MSLPASKATTRTVRAGGAIPCRPLDTSRLALHPLALEQVAVTAGWWADWQEANRVVTIPHGLRWLEREGVYDNFRRLIGTSDAPRRGEVYADSDLYKVLEAMGWDLANEYSEDSARIIDAAAGLLRSAQGGDGYLNTVVQAGLRGRYENLVGGHELYCAGHLIQAAIALHRSTGDSALLDVARSLADCFVSAFVGGRRSDTDGHPEIETALVELYRETGERDYLTLAQQLIDVRGHGVLGEGSFGSRQLLDDVPVRDRTEIAGHAVRALYLLNGAIDVYIETGEAALLAAVERQWSSMVNTKSYITGALGSRFEGESFGDPYELPPDLAYGETCAAIASIMLAWRLLLVTGEGAYADAIERALYNVFSASTSLERDGFFYVNPLQRNEARPPAPIDGKPVSADAPGTRAAWYDTACCPPNIMRTVASLGGYVATADAGGLQLHQFIPSSVRAEVGGGEIALSVETDYPLNGDVLVRVVDTPPVATVLSFRMPGWSDSTRVTVNEAEVTVEVDAKGYLRLKREWEPDDLITLSFAMAVRLTMPHPAVDAVRGSVAVERGPLVFCVETVLEDARSTPALEISSIELDPESEIIEVFDLERQPGISLRTQGFVRVGDGDSPPWSAFDGSASVTRAPVDLSFIPYALWANRGPSCMRVWIPLTSS